MPLALVLLVALGQAAARYPGDYLGASGTPAATSFIKAACLGNSITAGGSGHSYPDELWALLEPDASTRGTRYKVDNMGIPGDTAANMVSRWRSSIQGKGYHVLVLLAGTNDLTGGASAATIWGNLSTIANEARADGLRVVLLTILPRHGTASTDTARGDWSSDLQTRLESVNASIRQWWAGTGAPAVDSYAVMGDPAKPTYLLDAYNADGLHPNPAGYVALAAAVRPALP